MQVTLFATHEAVVWFTIRLKAQLRFIFSPKETAALDHEFIVIYSKASTDPRHPERDRELCGSSTLVLSLVAHWLLSLTYRVCSHWFALGRGRWFL